MCLPLCYYRKCHSPLCKDNHCQTEFQGQWFRLTQDLHSLLLGGTGDSVYMCDKACFSQSLPGKSRKCYTSDNFQRALFCSHFTQGGDWEESHGFKVKIHWKNKILYTLLKHFYIHSWCKATTRGEGGMTESFLFEGQDMEAQGCQGKPQHYRAALAGLRAPFPPAGPCPGVWTTPRGPGGPWPYCRYAWLWSQGLRPPFLPGNLQWF